MTVAKTARGAFQGCLNRVLTGLVFRARGEREKKRQGERDSNPGELSCSLLAGPDAGRRQRFCDRVAGCRPTLCDQDAVAAPTERYRTEKIRAGYRQKANEINSTRSKGGADVVAAWQRDEWQG